MLKQTLPSALANDVAAAPASTLSTAISAVSVPSNSTGVVTIPSTPAAPKTEVTKPWTVNASGLIGSVSIYFLEWARPLFDELQNKGKLSLNEGLRQRVAEIVPGFDAQCSVAKLPKHIGKCLAAVNSGHNLSQQSKIILQLDQLVSGLSITDAKALTFTEQHGHQTDRKKDDTVYHNDPNLTGHANTAVRHIYEIDRKGGFDDEMVVAQVAFLIPWSSDSISAGRARNHFIRWITVAQENFQEYRMEHLAEQLKAISQAIAEPVDKPKQTKNGRQSSTSHNSASREVKFDDEFGNELENDFGELDLDASISNVETSDGESSIGDEPANHFDKLWDSLEPKAAEKVNYGECLVCMGDHTRPDAERSAALDKIIERFKVIMISRMMAKCADPEILGQVWNDTMLVFWKGEFKVNPSQNAAGIIYIIARNKLVDILRHPYHRRRMELDEATLGHLFERELTPTDSPDEQAAIMDDILQLRRLMKTLPEPQQETLRGTFLEDRSQRDFADFSGTPLGTIKTRIELAVRKLGDRFKR